MAETVIYRGPSGTTIDKDAMEVELGALGFSLELHRDSARMPEPLGGEHYFKVMSSEDDPCTARIMRGAFAISSESFPARERVEGTARLLRRVLPEPAKVIAHMSDERHDDFIGRVTNIGVKA